MKWLTTAGGASTRPLVVHAPGLAGLRALDGVGIEDAHRRGNAHQGLDALLHPLRDLAAFGIAQADRKSTRLNSSHLVISYAVFCLKKKNNRQTQGNSHHRHLLPT